MANYTITAANVLASASAVRFSGPASTGGVCIALSACTAGQPVYQDPTTLKFAPAVSASSATTSAAVGICEQNAAAGQPITVVVSDSAFNPGITTLAAGDLPCLSSTAGAIAPHGDTSSYSSGFYITSLGVATSATSMKLSPVQAGAGK